MRLVQTDLAVLQFNYISQAYISLLFLAISSMMLIALPELPKHGQARRRQNSWRHCNIFPDRLNILIFISIPGFPITGKQIASLIMKPITVFNNLFKVLTEPWGKKSTYYYCFAVICYKNNQMEVTYKTKYKEEGVYVSFYMTTSCFFSQPYP